jgi:FOG: TPR repeat, SEL1 subfamily
MNSKKLLVGIVCGMIIIAIAGFIYRSSGYSVSPDQRFKIYQEMTFEKMVSLAERGSNEMQFLVGWAYERGKSGIQINLPKAIQWYEKSAKDGNTNAKVALARLYEYGRGVCLSREKAEMLAKEALEGVKRDAETGDLFAQYLMGWLYDEGVGVPEDNIEAIKWYRKAGNQNFPAALNALGIQYEEGEVVQKDESEAVRMFKKAAEQGYALGAYNLSRMYLDGKGVPKNDKEAAKWLGLAAELT